MRNGETPLSGRPAFATGGDAASRACYSLASLILASSMPRIDASHSGQMVYLVTAFNKPFTAAGFGNRFRDWCDEAG